MLRDADHDIDGLLNLEADRFGMDHCEAGRELAARWNLPLDFAVAAGRHHDTPSGGPADLLGVVHLACCLADVLGFSVVTPMRLAAFEEATGLLPDAARGKFESDPGVLRTVVRRRLESFDLAGAPSAPAARPEAAEAPPEPPAPARSLLRDAALVAAMAAVCAAIMLGAWLLWGR